MSGKNNDFWKKAWNFESNISVATLRMYVLLFYDLCMVCFGCDCEIRKAGIARVRITLTKIFKASANTVK